MSLRQSFENPVRSQATSSAPNHVVAHKELNYGIDTLRGIAILLVFLFHIEAPGFSFAYLGVDLFFVISGYLMGSLYSDIWGWTAMSNFYVKRARRIAPAYYVVITIVIIISSFSVLPFEYEYVMRSALLGAAFLANFDIWLQSGYFVKNLFRPLLHLWSLGVEVQFYVVFPLLVSFLHRRKGAICLVFALSLAAYVLGSFSSPKTVFLMMPTRLWQFTLGYFAAVCAPSRSRALYLGSTMMFVCCIIILPLANAGPTMTTVLVSALAGLAAWASTAASAPNLLTSRFLSQLSKYSYSIYLTHVPIIAFLIYRPFEPGAVGLHSILQRVIVLLATATASLALFHFVERPAYYIKDGKKVMFLLVAGASFACLTAMVAPQVVGVQPSGRKGLAANAWLDRLPERCPKLGRILHPFDKSCLISGTGRRVALLIGDSHADVLKKILGEELVRGGESLRLMINHSGIYLSTTDRSEVEKARSHVDGFSVHVLHPADAVAEARRWHAEKIVVHARADHTETAALSELVKLAERENIKVYVILPVPNPDFSVPERLFDLARDDKAPQSFVLAARNRLPEPDLQTLRALATSSSSLHILDPWSYLCVHRQCAIADSAGKPYYSDDQHLTQTGVEIIRPMLAQVMN